MTKYIKREMPRLNGSKTPSYYYTIDKVARMSTKEFLAHIATHYGDYDAATMTSMLHVIASELAEQMAQGRSVELEGIGVFRAGLGVDKDKASEREDLGQETGHRNARSLSVDHIIFRADKRLVTKTDQKCRLESGGESLLREPATTLEERAASLRAFLDDPEHPVARIADYCRLTGLSSSKAQKELNKLSHDPTSGIRATGARTHRVYLKA